MPNVLVVPVSGAIFFDRNAAGASTVAALNSAVRLNYDNGGGLNITSYAAALTALDRFTVDGAQGRLFSVTDALTGSLMSVNDITGLPILEVLDTDTVIAGSYNTNTFIVSGTRIAIGRTIDSTAKVAISGNTTVSGTLSTNNLITALGGNSNQWNSNYATTSTLSSSWTDLGFTVPIQSNSVVLELSAFSYFLINLNANISSMTFRNPKAAPQITSFALQLSADGTARSVAWPASIRWPGGTAPTITSTANKVDTFAFFSYDSGISYYGFATGTNS
jgi:hypothetical protein